MRPSTPRQTTPFIPLLLGLISACGLTGCIEQAPASGDVIPAPDAARDADGSAPDARPDDRGVVELDAGPDAEAPADQFVAPPPAAQDVLGWRADGDHARMRIMSFPGDGMLGVIAAHGALALPTLDGVHRVDAAPDGLRTKLLAWLDSDGRIGRIAPIMVHDGGRDLEDVVPLGDGLLATVDLSDGWQYPLEGGPDPLPGETDTWAVEIDPDGSVRPVMGLTNARITAATRRGRLTVIAGTAYRELEGSVWLQSGDRIDLPPDAIAWFLVISPDEAARLSWFAGTTEAHVQSVAVTDDLGVWACIDALGLEFGETVVLDPGGRTETTFAVNSRPAASDMILARFSPSGEVEASWMHISPISGGRRLCAMRAMGDELVVISPQTATRGQPPVYVWVDADGNETTVPLDGPRGFETETVLARFMADGAPVWWRRVGSTLTGRPWFTDDTVRIYLGGQRRHVVADLERGEIMSTGEVGYDRAVMLPDGRFATVIHRDAEDRQVVSGDARFVCPPAARFCVVVHR